jgi:hypothetical protein
VRSSRLESWKMNDGDDRPEMSGKGMNASVEELRAGQSCVQHRLREDQATRKRTAGDLRRLTFGRCYWSAISVRGCGQAWMLCGCGMGDAREPLRACL